MKYPFVQILLLLFILISCNNEELPVKKSNASQTTTVESIKKLGFDGNNVIDKGSFYLVEGDIYFSKAAGYKKVEVPEVTTNQLEIRVGVVNAISNNEAWSKAINDAMNDWNNIEDIKIHFVLGDKSTADIVVESDSSLPEDLTAVTEFPTENNVHSKIRINPTRFFGNERNEMAHLLGHLLGFRHVGKEDHVNDKSGKSELVVTLFGLNPTPLTKLITFRLFAIQDNKLYRISQSNGFWSQIDNGDWSGTESMTSFQEHLYIVKNDILYWVLKKEGYGGALGGGWAGTQAMGNLSNAYYAIQLGYLYSVDESGGWQEVGGGHRYDDVEAMTTLFYYNFFAAVMQGKLYYIIPGSIPEVLSNDDWSGTAGMAYIADSTNPQEGYLYIIRNNALYRVNIHNGSKTWISGGWTNVEGMDSLRGLLYIIQDGTLYRVDPSNGSKYQLGRTGDWHGTVAFLSDEDF